MEEQKRLAEEAYQAEQKRFSEEMAILREKVSIFERTMEE